MLPANVLCLCRKHTDGEAPPVGWVSTRWKGADSAELLLRLVRDSAGELHRHAW